MPAKKIEKLVKFEDPIFFHAKPEKAELLRKYCDENRLDLLTVVENIPEDKFAAFDKFLIDNGILAEKTSYPIAIPRKNKALLQELRNFAAANNFKVEISGTSARIVDIPVDVENSAPFTKLMIRIEKSFNQEMEAET